MVEVGCMRVGAQRLLHSMSYAFLRAFDSQQCEMPARPAIRREKEKRGQRRGGEGTERAKERLGEKQKAT